MLNSDIAPDVENPILNQMEMKSIGFQPLKIGFSDLFSNGAISELKEDSDS